MASERDDLVARLRAAGCVFAEDEARMLREAAQGGRELEQMVAERVAGLPLEHILGWAEFCGLRVAVGPGVFVPRRRTELLANEAATHAAPGSVVVELCCGVAAISAALLARIEGIELYAADIDPEATRFARANVGERGVVLDGDLFAPLPESIRGRVDVLVANAPYVPTEAIAFMPPEARLHEARVALDGGGDGLELHRRIAAGAPEWLAPGGWLLIESSEQQAPRTAALFERAGLLSRVVRDEELDGTVVIGQRVGLDS
ncbi:release factor glutamine methyltransferase [Homoserinimonas aerilata]|uniref:peptide chain release factor N(5)-glutamine methyltransferase n=1 Tax=Homoserinimonas aerilata TaxID=1162970 RepID=A0A542YGK4_9MICO|nr:putative protein N(5)-glutamine methyltransferase [Homoserinimonas aerilata]TQL47207.1 release factor glutamine methyltransferase [Homoserinimonas aerilata]